MYLKAQETAQLYNSLSVKLGAETTDVLFKYIDNKTERSVEASINTLATKEDIGNVRKDISQSKADTIKWMFIFWIGQVSVTLAIMMLIFNK
jgi:hypothetical protein